MLIIPALISAIPSIIKLFDSDEREEGVKDLTTIAISKASEALGIPFGSKDELINHLNDNPEVVYKLKQLEYDTKELMLKYKLLENKEISERWKSDNKSGSGFARLIRPLIVTYLIFISTVLAILDGNISDFTVKAVWADLFVLLCITAVGGYFALRTYEKKTKSNKW